MKAGDKGAVSFRQLRQAPLAHVVQHLAPGGAGALIRALDAAQQPGVGVAHDDRTIEPPEPLHNLSRLRAALHGVAQAHELLDRVGRRQMREGLRDRLARPLQLSLDGGQLRLDRGVQLLGAILHRGCGEGIGALDKDTHQKALLDKDPALRRNAIRALPANEAGRRLFFSSAVIQDPDLLTRQVALTKLAEFPTIPEIQTVVAQLPRVAANMSDPFLNDTLTLLGRIHKVAAVGEDEVKIAAGDVKRGEDLFFNSPVAACASCHMVNGRGGDVGPILDGIAVRADKAHIMESLMDPNAKLAKGFESLTISPMPPLGVLLKEQEVADILAYLDTLKTPPKDGVTVPVKKVNPYE